MDNDIKPININSKKILLKKIVGLALIITPMIQTYAAAKDIFMVLPTISFMGNLSSAQTIYYDLIRKALAISTGLVLDSVYGFSLLLRPAPTTRYIHIVFGIFLFFGSIYLFYFADIGRIVQQIDFLPIS